MKNVRPLGMPHRAAVLVLSVLVAALAGCGGGSDGGTAFALGPAAPSAPAAPEAPPPAPVVPDASAPTVPTVPEPPAEWPYPWDALAGQCAAPRAGIDPATGVAFVDRPGTLDTEKRWVRTWLDETYLWFDELPSLNAADYESPIDYFFALKTPALTGSGRAKDLYHFVLDTADFQAQFADGAALGYGFELVFLNSAPPRELRVLYTEPGSPAATAAIGRGTELIALDGIDVIASEDVDGLNAALNPEREGETHSFTLRAPGVADRTVVLTASRITHVPVQNTRTIETPTGRVGYLLFNDHIEPAEAQLIAAVQQLKDAAIDDLVLDLRYNGGGLLAIANELAYMVATPAATDGTVFERVRFNSKNPFRYAPDATFHPFYSKARGLSAPLGQPLPQLGLSRVTVLTTSWTCSASESIINGLRGVGITVNVLGDTTCGKPYGFYPEDNCGSTYLAVQTQATNQLGFGDYADGFAPTCAVADDLTHELGDPAEGLLAAALDFRVTGACPAPQFSRRAAVRSQAGTDRQPSIVRSPLRENRILSRP